MISYQQGLGDVPLRGETIGEMWDATVAAHGDRDALVSRHQGIRWTYAEMQEQVERCARGLLARGVRAGDRVGIWAPNCAEWVVLQFATAKVGAILVNVNPSYRLHELEYGLRQSGCSLLVLAPGFRDADYRELVAAADTPELRQTVVLGDDWERLLADGDAVPVEELRAREAEQAFDLPINIQYTSGTTGFPKGATLSHHNILNNGFFIGEELGYTPADRVCIPVPFYHCFGMVLGNLAVVTHGACIVIPAEAFEPGAVLATVAEERCTSLYGVPTMFIAELAHPEFASFDLSTLRTGIMAGSPCPVEVMRRVTSEMHMHEVTICYGMTETSPVSTQTPRGAPLDKQVGTVGRVHPHVEVKIVDPVSGRTLPRGEAGELCTRGYSVMLGYWQDEDATRAAIDAGRWMHTGDLATMDDEGYVNVVGRIKDMIIRGGENVYPREIEEFLYTHPEITDVQVFGVPDERYGEEICAWIVVKDGSALDEESVREFCQGKIARFKVPRYVRVVDAFPMTVTGKVQKFRMREQEIEERGLQAAASAQTA
ncbi:MAG TPA: AMP-binding protein [Gaiellaceae bacterium]|nr:AMP-binding protein [Gaiellaceae bacterium]